MIDQVCTMEVPTRLEGTLLIHTLSLFLFSPFSTLANSFTNHRHAQQGPRGLGEGPCRTPGGCRMSPLREPRLASAWLHDGR